MVFGSFVHTLSDTDLCIICYQLFDHFYICETSAMCPTAAAQYQQQPPSSSTAPHGSHSSPTQQPYSRHSVQMYDHMGKCVEFNEMAAKAAAPAPKFNCKSTATQLQLTATQLQLNGVAKPRFMHHSHTTMCSSLH